MVFEIGNDAVLAEDLVAAWALCEIFVDADGLSANGACGGFKVEFGVVRVEYHAGHYVAVGCRNRFLDREAVYSFNHGHLPLSVAGPFVCSPHTSQGISGFRSHSPCLVFRSTFVLGALAGDR